MTTTITRDRGRGLLYINGSPAVLRGCSYDLLFNPKQSVETLAYANTETPIKPQYEVGSNPCQTEFPQARYVAWAEGLNTFEEFFQTMTASRCNFVRVFLSGGVLKQGNTLVSMTPFNYTAVNNRIMYDVRGAALGGSWNAAYFERLRAFIAAADAAGVVVQLSLFNYFDMANDNGNPAASALQWTASPWNAANCLNGGTWAAQHLIPSSLDFDDRQRYFITPSNELRAVQQEYIGRVIQAASGYRNVVLELMNEPHATTDLSKVAEFDSYMTKLVMLYRRNLNVQALISINATPLGGSNELQVWKQNGLPNFLEPDIVSYHGLTMLPNNNQFIGCDGRNKVSVERVDPGAISTRAAEHANTTPDKAILFSTDAVKSTPFIHFYNDRALEMRPRDGQIICGPENDDLEAQLLRTNVSHWAKNCLVGNTQNAAAKGRYHFHNHSSFKLGVRAVGLAATGLGL